MNSCDEQFDNPVYRTHQDNKIVKGVCEIEFSSAHISLAGRWSCWLYECENSGHDCWTNNDITEGGSMMNLTRKEFLVEVKFCWNRFIILLSSFHQHPKSFTTFLFSDQTTCVVFGKCKYYRA